MLLQILPVWKPKELIENSFLHQADITLLIQLIDCWKILKCLFGCIWISGSSWRPFLIEQICHTRPPQIDRAGEWKWCGVVTVIWWLYPFYNFYIFTANCHLQRICFLICRSESTIGSSELSINFAIYRSNFSIRSRELLSPSGRYTRKANYLSHAVGLAPVSFFYTPSDF
jgi:hypothetical protein